MAAKTVEPVFECRACEQAYRPLASGLVCPSCESRVPVINGIYHFTQRNMSMSEVNYGVRGWEKVEAARERQLESRDGYSHEWLRALPFPADEKCTTFQLKQGALGRNFLGVLDELGLRGDETVIDLAAGTCWTSRELATRGCRVFATDMRAMKYSGLNSAEAYFEAGTPRFERMCWRFGSLPIRSQSIDLAFCNNAFQYVQDIEAMLGELRRVLRPNGRIALSWTGSAGPLKWSKAGPGMSLSRYVSGARNSGLIVERCEVPAALFRDGKVLKTRQLTVLETAIHSLAASCLGILLKAPERLLLNAGRLVGLPSNLILRRPIL